MSKGRLEAFSDGVFAIIVTLLVLDLHAPTGGETIFQAFDRQLPQLAVYAISFLFVGVTWMNHHAVLRAAAHIDRLLVLVNLLLLMVIALTPFGASLVADGLRRGGSDARQGAFVYSAIFLGVGLAFAALWLSVTRPAVLAEHLDPTLARRSLVGFGAGNVVYAGLCGLSFVAPWVVVAGHSVVAGYYVLDLLPEDRLGRRPAVHEGAQRP